MTSNSTVTVLESKGNFHLCKYENGLYAVEKCTKSVGQTLFASFNRSNAEWFFKAKCSK